MRFFVILSILVAAAHISAVEPSEQDAGELVEKLGVNRFRLGDIIIDKNADSITFPAEVNMNEGLLELLLCTPYGKTHESLFVTEVDAIHLNLALIMIGCQKGRLVPKHQGDDVIPDGSLLTIEVVYEDEAGKQSTVRAEDWVYNKKAGLPMKHTDWVYTGSFVQDGDYMAKITGTYIVTFHDPNAIIDLPLKEAADDTVFWINTDTAKKKGYPVELVITRVKDREPDQEAPAEEREEKTEQKRQSRPARQFNRTEP